MQSIYKYVCVSCHLCMIQRGFFFLFNYFFFFLWCGELGVRHPSWKIEGVCGQKRVNGFWSY